MKKLGWLVWGLIFSAVFLILNAIPFNSSLIYSEFLWFLGMGFLLGVVLYFTSTKDKKLTWLKNGIIFTIVIIIFKLLIIFILNKYPGDNHIYFSPLKIIYSLFLGFLYSALINISLRKNKGLGWLVFGLIFSASIILFRILALYLPYIISKRQIFSVFTTDLLYSILTSSFIYGFLLAILAVIFLKIKK